MRKIKKMVAVVLVICMIVCSCHFNIMAQAYDSVGLYNIAIRGTYYDFTSGENGTVNCCSSVTVGQGYTVQLTMQLQQKTKSGMWKNVQSWTNMDTYYVVFDETYQVEKGYDYRLMVVYIAYDSNGNQVESFYDVSNVIRYE
ncbi:MAG: hypothetical protein IKU60_04735 [Clostridia bacterium]|nr:hypothetical protein [Clostridia bacterium]